MTVPTAFGTRLGCAQCNGGRLTVATRKHLIEHAPMDLFVDAALHEIDGGAVHSPAEPSSLGERLPSATGDAPDRRASESVVVPLPPNRTRFDGQTAEERRHLDAAE